MQTSWFEFHLGGLLKWKAEANWFWTEMLMAQTQPTWLCTASQLAAGAAMMATAEPTAINGSCQYVLTPPKLPSFQSHMKYKRPPPSPSWTCHKTAKDFFLVFQLWGMKSASKGQLVSILSKMCQVLSDYLVPDFSVYYVSFANSWSRLTLIGSAIPQPEDGKAALAIQEKCSWTVINLQWLVLIKIHLASFRRRSTFTRGWRSSDNTAAWRHPRREGGSLVQNMHGPETFNIWSLVISFIMFNFLVSNLDIWKVVS